MTEQEEKFWQRFRDAMERDNRNQQLIDNFKRVSWKERLMVYLHDNGFRLALLFCIVFWMLVLSTLHLWAAECPTVEPCRILTLTAQEEKILTAPNGVLDTAAQGRALELGQFVVYLKQRISSSPMGDPPPKQDLTVPQK